MLQKTVGATIGGALMCMLGSVGVADEATDGTSTYYEIGDGPTRISKAGKMRMLSQRIASASCYMVSGFETQVAPQMMEADIAEFNQILAALEFGDDDLEITSPEDSRRVLTKIKSLHDVWDSYALFVSTSQSGAEDDAFVAQVWDGSVGVLDATVVLVDGVIEAYYDPVVTVQSEAITINLASRQRMLIQRMGKNVCLIEAGVNVEAAREDVTRSFELFDRTLAALQTGFEPAGVTPPPSTEVEAALAVVAADWADLGPLIQRAIDGEVFDKELNAQVFQDVNALTDDMNAAVDQYTAASALARFGR